MSELYRIPLQRVKPSKEYTWQEKLNVHYNTARSKYGRVFGAKSFAEGQSNEPITDFSDDIGYFGPATLGGQKFQFLFDTGSSDLWVPRVGVDEGGNPHNTFNPSKSSTFKTDEAPFSIQYGTGSTSGIAATDTFKIAGFTIRGQAFGLADTVSSDFDNSPFDGILGMGFQTLSQLQSPTPFENLVNDDDVSSSVFSFLLGREKDGTSSELILGGLDPRFANNISNNEIVDGRGFWQIGLDGAQVNGKSVKVSSSQAIIDTGTTLVYMPARDADAIHKAIPGHTKQNGMYLIPTNTNAVVSFVFNGVSYPISTKDLALDDAGNGFSVSGIQGQPVTGDNSWLVGDVFLKNVFSAFDTNKKTVGFASNHSE